MSSSIETVREKRSGRRPLSEERMNETLQNVRSALTDRSVAILRVDTAKEELKAAKETLDGIESHIIKLNELMVHGEQGTIDVDVTYDYGNAWVTVFDGETGEILEEREMTSEDRQSSLDLDEDEDRAEGETDRETDRETEPEPAVTFGVPRIELDEDDPGDEYPDRSSGHFTGASE